MVIKKNLTKLFLVNVAAFSLLNQPTTAMIIGSDTDDVGSSLRPRNQQAPLDSSLSELENIRDHWLCSIEQQRFCAEEHISDLGDTYFRMAIGWLDHQKTFVEDFSSKIGLSSLPQLLDELLLYRMRWIKTRKEVIEIGQSGTYVELAPLSEERKSFYNEAVHPFSALRYEMNMVASICLHQLIKAVFKRIEDPTQLNAHTKHKLRVQPSLFAYLHESEEIPWALDFTLGLDVVNFPPYHPIPDYSLIRDYVERYGYEKNEVKDTKLEIITLPMLIPNFSTMYTFQRRIILTRFEAKQCPTHPALKDANEFAKLFEIEFSLPNPEFLRKRPAPKPVARPSMNVPQEMSIKHPPAEVPKKTESVAVSVSTSESVPQTMSTGESAAEAPRKTESVAISDAVPIELTTTEKQAVFKSSFQLPSASPSVRHATEETSIFTKVEKWLNQNLFNHRIKTISGAEWESVLNRTKGVSIKTNSGSSHFEVLINGRVIGGYFRAKEYGVGYKKWLRKIILDLGFSPATPSEE